MATVPLRLSWFYQQFLEISCFSNVLRSSWISALDRDWVVHRGYIGIILLTQSKVRCLLFEKMRILHLEHIPIVAVPKILNNVHSLLINVMRDTVLM